MKQSGPAPVSTLTLSNWESWAQLKSGYGASYATLIEALRRQASGDWQTERLATEVGEGLRQGQTYRLALLYPEAQYTFAGDGAKAIQAEFLVREGLPPALQLRVLQTTPGAELPLEVVLSYPHGAQETVKFILVGLDAQMSSGTITPQNWGSWHEYWAGYENPHFEQRFYNQIPAGTSPNTSPCWSGCGATAWAMLFGWADHQAALGNSTWASHWGIYRQDGGTGADADAPPLMISGVRNMTWEIRAWIGTFCASGQGATLPWEMWWAFGYLLGRDSGLSIVTGLDVFGTPMDWLRDRAAVSIMGRDTPAIIGTGWLSHYPLAYGYRWRSRLVRHCRWWWCWEETQYQHAFYVNQGLGGSNNGWIAASTWFSGEIYP
jgi:hypothetical protein